jgi:hypothetical protein
MNNVFKKASTFGVALAFLAAPAAFGQVQQATDPGSNPTTLSGGNDGTVLQGTNSTSSGNEATIQQVYVSQDAVSGLSNYSLVEQDGTDNEVQLLAQYGSGNFFSIDQDGVENIVRQFPDQGSASDGRPSVDGVIGITQDGEGNVVWDADQRGLENKLLIEQRGDDNFADFESQVTVEEGSGNFASILQDGDGNKVGQAGTGFGAYQQGSSNSMMIEQTGNDNEAGTQQVPLANLSTGGLALDPENQGSEGGQSLNQIGDGHVFELTQDGDDDLRFLLQDGSGNEAYVMQGAGANAHDITQIGTSNYASVTQN